MGLWDRLFGRSDALDYLDIEGPGSFLFEIVGEASYQSALSRIAGGRSPDGCNLVVDAVLILEDSNVYDPNAVLVAIQGEVCGYLSRADARKYRAGLRAAGRPTVAVRCKAKIVGGWDRGKGDVGHFGVKLDLPNL